MMKTPITPGEILLEEYLIPMGISQNAMARAIGETAPLILVGAVGFVSYLPTPFEGGYTVLPIQIYQWASRPQDEFQALAASAIGSLAMSAISSSFT